MGNSTYHEPEDLGHDQDERDASIPGRKYFVYVLETDFGHYVGHTARLHQRINEHLRGDPTTMNSNPRPAWNSGPFTTRRAAQRFEAALKSWRDQRSRTFKDRTGLEPEPFIKPEFSQINEFFGPARKEDRYRHPRGMIQRNRGVDVKKTLAWFIVVFVLTFAIGYALGFRDAQLAIGLLSYVGIFGIVGAVCFAVFRWRQNLGRAFPEIPGRRWLTDPIVGDHQNTWIAIGLSLLLGAVTGGSLGYNLGLSTAHSVTGFFSIIGVITLVLIGIFIFIKWQTNRPDRGRRSRR